MSRRSRRNIRNADRSSAECTVRPIAAAIALGTKAEIGHRREIDKPDIMLDGLGHARGNGEGDRRLSDPCGSDNRNESCSFAHRQDRVAGLSSSEDARCGDWKIVCTEAGRSVIVCSRIVTEDLDGGDGPVAPPLTVSIYRTPPRPSPGSVGGPRR